METAQESCERSRSRTETRVTFGPIQLFIIDNENRQSVWEQMARDRIRFNRRIQDANSKIGYVSEQSHRTKMYHKIVVK